MRARGWLFLLCLSQGIAGCMVGPDYRQPEIRTPSKYGGAQDHHNRPPPDDWWTVFNDPILNRLIKEAAAFNLDVKEAAQRILMSRADRARTIAEGLPSLGGRANVSQRRNDFITGSGSQNPAAGGYFGYGLIDLIQAGFDVQWEIDPAGGLFRRIESRDALVEAEQDYRRAIKVSLTGEIARLYINVRSNQERIRITRSNINTQEDTLGLTRARSQGGLGTMLEVAQQEAQLESTRSDLHTYTIAARQDLHALAVLLGRTPDSLLYLLETETGIPRTPTDILPDLPSELLRRRPDILQAERQLAAATADVGNATAQLYPKLNLTMFLGLQNMKLSDFSPVGKSWAMAGGVTTPIFNWGRIQANIDHSQAYQEEALLNYQETILTAFREVEDALVAYREEQQRRVALEHAVEANHLAFKLANERYLRGLSTFLNVLESERTLFQSQVALISSNARISTSLAALYKALGGGWRAFEPSDTAADAPRR